MAIISCPKCSKRVSSRMETCPHCGTTLSGDVGEAAERNTAKRRRCVERTVNLHLFLSLIVLAVGVLWFFGEQRSGRGTSSGPVAVMLLGGLWYAAARAWGWINRRS